MREYTCDGDVDLDEESEFRHSAESMLLCDKPPRREPGEWYRLVPYLASHLELMPDDDLALNEGWKHGQVWPVYRRQLKKHLSRSQRKLLAHLDDGRAFRGKGIEYDGSVFTWLTTAEVRELHESLSQLEPSTLTLSELSDFHEDLVKTLEVIATQSRDLFAGA